MLRRRALLLALVLSPAAAGPALASAAGEAKKKGGGPTYLQFPTLTATILRPNGRRGVLTVEAGVDVANEALRERAEGLTPRLIDAYVQYLTSYAAHAAPGAPPNPDVIAASLQKATDQVLGKAGAKLLLGTVMVS